MAALHRAVATLRITGDDLSPDEVSRLLEGQPTTSQRKGQELRTASGRTRIARFGSWRLEAPATEPVDLDGQVATLLEQLTTNLETWQAIASRYQVDLFCGWFMGGENEGVAIAPATLLALGSRHIALSLDIYGPDGTNSNEA